ncbi:cytochrome c-type biogenesis protein CcdA [Haladaptatus paucihalophilus DX253]|nr:cytochrome c-type biogenesis protein CcdA [Haladaptatus paucihalophilus DX253]
MIIMIAFGATMADDEIHELYSKYTSKIAGRATETTTIIDEESHPIASALVLGLLLGVVWLPCVGPILGGVLAYVGTTGDVTRSSSLLFVYGLGFSLPLLAVSYGGKQGGRALVNILLQGQRPENLRKASGYVLIITGIAMLFDIDKLIMSLII